MRHLVQDSKQTRNTWLLLLLVGIGFLVAGVYQATRIPEAGDPGSFERRGRIIAVTREESQIRSYGFVALGFATIGVSVWGVGRSRG